MNHSLPAGLRWFMDDDGRLVLAAGCYGGGYVGLIAEMYASHNEMGAWVARIRNQTPLSFDRPQAARSWVERNVWLAWAPTAVGA